MIRPGITVTIASIPPRARKLRQALASVAAQTLLPQGIVVEYDHDRTGAAATKNRALQKVDTEWVAPLDDDDQFLPHHLETLHRCAQDTGADVVYSIPSVPQYPGGRLAIDRYGLPFDADELRRSNYISNSCLIRTELFQRTGGFQLPKDAPPASAYDDWGAFLALLDAGARFVHCPQETFIYNRWGDGGPGVPGNTLGLADRW